MKFNPIKSLISSSLAVGTLSLSCLPAYSQEDQTQCMKDKIIGKWAGVVKTPWTVSYQANIKFKPGFTYSSYGGWTCWNSNNPMSDDCLPFQQVAFYYGTDGESPKKTFQIRNVINNIGEGTIDIDFGTTGVTHDTLTDIRFVQTSGEGDDPCTVDSSKPLNLHFKMYHLGTYGPVSFNLSKHN